MYEVGTAVEVVAFHVMPGMDGPEGTLHSHDYRLEVVVEREALDDQGMVCDLDVLDAALAGAADHVRDADLDATRPEDAEAVTVEVFARWLHGRLLAAVSEGGGDVLRVRVWESPLAFGGYRARVT